ncbi:MAG: hypothetical protein K5917_04460 [Clostridiales bacterium]|nr:hypothetical protein [Clostridiales bacterium]
MSVDSKKEKVAKMSQKGKKGAKKSIKLKLMRSVAALLAISCFLVALAGNLVFASYCWKNMPEELQKRGEDAQRTVAADIALYKSYAEAIAMVDSITNTTLTIDERKAECKKLAEKYGFEAVSVADATGLTYNGSNVVDREYFKNAMQDKTYVSSTAISRLNGKTLMYVAAKIKNTTGWNGIVYCTMPMDVVQGWISEITAGKTGYGFIIDKEGVIIAHPNEDYVVSRSNFVELVKDVNKSDKEYTTYNSMAKLTEAMLANKSGDIKLNDGIKLDGKTVVAHYMRISDSDDWTICVLTPRSEMMTYYYSSIVFEVAILIVILVLSTVFVYITIVKPITNPISDLMKRVELMEKGDLHTEVPIPIVQDEIYSLSVDLQNTLSAINSYIMDISQILGNMASNDFTDSVDRDYKGDFSEIRTSLEHILVVLNEEFLAFGESSSQVSNGSAEVSNAAQALAQGATEQASAVQELSATIADINDKVKATADNAIKANEKGNEVGEEVQISAERMAELLSAMQDIDNASNEISNIMKTIEDIAFQTNILALNASVEAARAGEAGKGFSVVADEVRNLAVKCSDASKNTAELIRNSMELTKKGTTLADHTAESLNKVVETTQEVLNIVDNISMASQEQAKAIDQINLGVEQISSVVQTNSATAEQSAAASEQLNTQANNMNQAIAKFKLRANSGYIEPVETKKALPPVSEAPKKENKPKSESKPKRESKPVRDTAPKKEEAPKIEEDYTPTLNFRTDTYEINPSEFDFRPGDKY